MAPRKVRTRLGSPNATSMRRSRPWRKKTARLALPATWKTPTSRSAVEKSKKRSATGMRRVDEPKPAMVATTSAIKAEAKNQMCSGMSRRRYDAVGWLRRAQQNQRNEQRARPAGEPQEDRRAAGSTNPD